MRRFLPLAREIARRYNRLDEPLDDLVQVASLGLVKAIDRFDPERGVAFSTYAVPTMVGELKRHLRDTAWAVHLPRGLNERWLAVERAERELRASLRRSPTVAEIAERTKLSGEDVLAAIEAGARGERSLWTRRGSRTTRTVTQPRRRSAHRDDRARTTSVSSSSTMRSPSRAPSRSSRCVIAKCSSCASSTSSRSPGSPTASASRRCRSLASSAGRWTGSTGASCPNPISASAQCRRWIKERWR